MRQRILTALILLPTFLAALFWCDHTSWRALALLVLAVASWEWSQFFAPQARPSLWYSSLTTLLGGFLLWPLPLQAPTYLAPLYLCTLLFWLIAVPLWLYFKLPIRRARMMYVGWLVLIPAVLALVQLREIAVSVLLFFMLLVWVADSAAYFAGRRFGRHKLAPAISPGKTWEGAVGGMMAVYLTVELCAASGILPGTLAQAAPLQRWTFPALYTAYSIMGDLFESWMKRQVGLKDSGRIFPGHGGILDRIDALTPTLPFAAWWVLYGH